MCYYVQRVSDHTEHRLAPISEASVLLQEYRCLFSVRFYKPMPIIEQKYQDCCAICLKIPLESARYYAIIIKKERISIKYKRNFRLFSRTTRQSLFSVRFYKPMPIIEQKYQDCCAICLKIPLESARYYAIIIKKERISIKYKRNFRLFSRTTRQRPCWHGNLTTAGRDNGANV